MTVYCISKIFGNNWSSMFNTFNERTLVVLLKNLLSTKKQIFRRGISKFCTGTSEREELICSLTRCRQLIFRGKRHFGTREEVLDQIFLFEPFSG